MCDPGMDLSVDNHARNELLFQVTILDSVIWPSSLKALVGKKIPQVFKGKIFFCILMKNSQTFVTFCYNESLDDL